MQFANLTILRFHLNYAKEMKTKEKKQMRQLSQKWKSKKKKERMQALSQKDALIKKNKEMPNKIEKVASIDHLKKLNQGNFYVL